MKHVSTACIILLLSLGIALGQTTEKKAATAPAKTAVKKTTAPAAAKAKTTTKTTPAKKAAAAKKGTAAKKAAETAAPKAEAAQPKQPETAVAAPAAAPKADTSTTGMLKEYVKTKADEIKASKDTLINAGAEKVTKTKAKLGDKIKDFDPFAKPKPDSTKK